MFRPNILPKKAWLPTKRESQFSGPNIAPKKLWVPKKYEFQKKRNSCFLGPNIVSKKVWDPKNSMSSKKRNSYFFRTKHCAKKSVWHGIQKKYEFLFFGTHTVFWIPYFFRHNVWSEKCMSSFFWDPIPLFGTMFWPKKVRDPLFFGTHTLFFWIPYFFWHNVWPEKSMSSFFWGNAYFFWIPCFFRHNFWSEKSMSSFFWLFFVTMSGPKKVWAPFCWKSYFLFGFWHNVWPEKVSVVPFFRNC